MKYVNKFLFSRFFFVFVIIGLQLLFLYQFLSNIKESNIYFEFGAIASYGLNVILTVNILNKDSNPSYKMAWLTLIHILPLFGGLLYLLLSNHKIPKNLRIEMTKSLMIRKGFLRQNPHYQNIQDEDVRPQMEYILRNAYYPYYQNTNTEYFKSGESAFAKIKEDLCNAKKFIFLEFFIVKKGALYQEIKEILIEKVKAGVQVYFMYDDGGLLTSDSFAIKKDLEIHGIHVAVFNPVSLYLLLLSKSNNRDHRKIVVIDNVVAYTGGINLADEYANLERRFGHWKDSAIRLEGEAVKNFTAMFIQFYNASNTKEYLPYKEHLAYEKTIFNQAHILPFSDSPTDAEDVAYTVHLDLIHQARKYLYITTPYLVLDYALTEALRNAAKRGVEVHVIVPHIPDKKIVFMVTRANCELLVKAGVHIYEYTPGFIHAKVIVADDKIALVGTINMDFRSYYLHYECGVLLNDSQTIQEIKSDFLETKAMSQEISQDDIAKIPWSTRMLREIISVFSPLL